MTNPRTPYSHHEAKAHLKDALNAGLKVLGIEQTQLARVCDVSGTLVRDWLDPKHNASLPHHAYLRLRAALPALAAYLDTAMELSPLPQSSQTTALEICARVTQHDGCAIAARMAVCSDMVVTGDEARELLALDARQDAHRREYRARLHAIAEADPTREAAT